MCGGARGKRFLLRNSRLMLHQPLLGGIMEGTATDLSIEAEEILRLRKRIYELISRHTNKEMKQIEHDCDRNKWLSAEDAIEYGLADTILERMPDRR
jgi:ATP-dependent Clp protease protease subunit